MGNNYSQNPSTSHTFNQIPETVVEKRKEDGSIDNPNIKKRCIEIIPDEADSFVNIVNNLKCAEENGVKYLDFLEAEVNAFQFPKNRIYIRECYYKIFENICQIMSIKKYSRIVITGQPGIGKTSSIYALLFFIKNISSFEFDNNDEKYFSLIKEFNSIIRILEGDIKESQLETVLKKLKDYKDKKNKISMIEKLVNQNNGEYSKLVKECKKIEQDFKNRLDSENCEKIDSCLELINEWNNIELCDRSDDKKKGFNYYVLDDIFKREDKKYKDIYVIKGKKAGLAVDKKIYLLRDNILTKVIVDEDDINDSIIMVDTYSASFGNNNIVISISSPDVKNYESYRLYGKKLYIDSLDDDEIKEWFKLCVDPDANVDDSDEEFQKTSKRYGNIPRLIYYHYVYKANYSKNYWDYYKQLIESIVGTCSYNEFVKDYMNKDILRDNDLSNLILKYDLELKFDIDLLDYIFKPKDELKFISDDVKNYVYLKFNPPKNEKEYTELINNYKTYGDDSYMKKMALKQIKAYELSTEKTKLVIDKADAIDTKFELNSEKLVYTYYPEEKGFHFVYYILDENNFFDLIMDGVFIKVILGKGSVKYDDKNMKQSIEQSIKV